ncbi:MAG: PI-PLC domain-containing protein [Gemmatimonadaceae bacterium]
MATKKAATKAVGRPFKKGDPRINRTIPGTGRPPSELRAQLRGSFGDRIGILERFADGVMPLAGECPKCGHLEPERLTLPMDPADRLRAIDTLAKYGLGTRDELEVVSPDVQARLSAQAKLIASRKTWDAKALLSALDGVWV